MGVRRLFNLVDPQRIKESTLRGKRVAVDASIMIYACTYAGRVLNDADGRPTQHIKHIIAKLERYLALDVKLTFVFDGKPPAVKHATIEQRQQQRERDAKVNPQNVRDVGTAIKDTKAIIRMLGIPYVIVNGYDAEHVCAHLNDIGYVDVVMSNDADAIVYGARNVIRTIPGSTDFTLWTRSQFIRLLGGPKLPVAAAVLGCDFCKGIPRYASSKLRDVDKIQLNSEQIEAVRQYESIPVYEICTPQRDIASLRDFLASRLIKSSLVQ
jgi:5'-3' exonuclease